MATLRDVLPPDFLLEYSDTPTAKLLDVEVTKECDATKPGERWPGKHKHVFAWWILANGKAVGWNENPGRGWSFPIVKHNA